MSRLIQGVPGSFHSLADLNIFNSEFVTEIDLSYRFFLHQHPFVQSLMRRCQRGGVNALQNADTEYDPQGISVAFGVDIELLTELASHLPANIRLTIAAPLSASTPQGTLQIDRGTELVLLQSTSCRLFVGTSLTLSKEMEAVPLPRTSHTLNKATEAALSADTLVELVTSAVCTFAGVSGPVTLPASTRAILSGDTELELPSNAGVRVLRRRMRPVGDLYDDFFRSMYNPNDELVLRPYPVKDLDFSAAGAYSVYNWELFFHVPLTIAMHLSKNQRFAEAQRWFHYIFDPTDDSDGPTPERFWKVRPFHSADIRKVEELLVNLATGGDANLRNETIRSMEAWQDQPFRPHVVARFRQQAYMYKTVMAYLDNLIAWGDSLFRQDTGEAIDEALMLYIMAANILGPRPLPVPKKGTIRKQTYSTLRRDLSQFGAVMKELEPELPFDIAPFPASDSNGNVRLGVVRSLGKALYFCVPRNDKLLAYWDTVADRLFKIRNSLNFQGTFRQLALFDPPIDPALLARATAAGLDVGAVLNGLNQPLPLVRFVFLVQKAAEIAAEVKSLGANLLSAMEREDGEAFALLRAKYETSVMEMAEHVKYYQYQEATKSKESLVQSLALAVHRFTFYERQLGKSNEDIGKTIPVLAELEKTEKASLAQMNCSLQEPFLELRKVDVDIASGFFADAAGALSGGKLMSSHEVRECLLLEVSQFFSDVSNVSNAVASSLAPIPTVRIQGAPVGVGGAGETGGLHFSRTAGGVANSARSLAERASFEARRASRIDTFARREREWAFQSNLAAGEINSVFKQIRAAQIREVAAEQELKNHRLQKADLANIEQFLNAEGLEGDGKRTNKALYAWMKRETKALYAQCFQFAFDIARRAERALQHELGNSQINYLQYGYLSGNEGLLAGEKLLLDIKRMEMAYHEQNQRELELTKHVSLLQVDPLALLTFRATGGCTVKLPESLFDMDGPGLYFRRIRTVAVSIPCVAGPHASVNCTLTLLKSSIRTSSVAGDSYSRSDSNDVRFSDYFGSLQAIVTSSAQNDSGLFDGNTIDQRYLPFEYSGVISEWQLQLPADPGKGEPAQFDYGTISDVLLHIRYTARDGGGQLRSAALSDLNTLIATGKASGSVRLLSVRHEFPTDWARFLAQTDNAATRRELTINLREEHYPFWGSAKEKKVTNVDLFAKVPGTVTSLSVFEASNSPTGDTLVKEDATGMLMGALTNIPRPNPVGQFSIFFEGPPNVLPTDLWIAVTWCYGA